MCIFVISTGLLGLYIQKLFKYVTWTMFLSVNNLCCNSEFHVLSSLLSVYIFEVYLMFPLEIFEDI